MEFSRQEYWRMLLFPSPGDLPDPGIKLRSPALRGDSLSSGSPGECKARWITLNVLNCPTDERPGRLYQSCFKAAAWIHSSWWKAISRLIPVMRSHCWQKWFPTMVTAGGAAASSWNESSCWRWHSKNPCRRERGVDGAAGLGGVLERQVASPWASLSSFSSSETLSSIYFALKLQLEEEEAIPLSTGKVEIVFHFLITQKE